MIHEPNTVLKVIGVDEQVALRLPEIPRTTVPDMPDRIFAATALHYNMPLVTRDAKIADLTQIKVVW